MNSPNVRKERQNKELGPFELIYLNSKGSSVSPFTSVVYVTEQYEMTETTNTPPHIFYLTIHNEMGLHARPSAQLAELAGQFESDIMVEFHGKTVNAKSMINLMTLAAEQGETLTLKISGRDHKQAYEALKSQLSEGF